MERVLEGELAFRGGRGAGGGAGVVGGVGIGGRKARGGELVGAVVLWLWLLLLLVVVLEGGGQAEDVAGLGVFRSLVTSVAGWHSQVS